jgi:hypothetical protein
MAPAPGFDAFLPHDLVHFVVEREWGLQHGIFGQLAEGGDAGTFVPVRLSALRREGARGARIRAAHRSDTGQSERLAHVAYVAWRSRRGHEVAAWDLEAVGEAGDADAALLERAVERLDELAQRWHALQVGGSISLPWPWPEGPRHAAAKQRRDRDPDRWSRARASGAS